MVCTYDDFKEHKLFGYYAMGRKMVVVRDLELAKQILVRDFDHFMDRRPIGLGKGSYLSLIHI